MLVSLPILTPEVAVILRRHVPMHECAPLGIVRDAECKPVAGVPSPDGLNHPLRGAKGGGTVSPSNHASLPTFGWSSSLVRNGTMRSTETGSADS